MKKHYVAVKIDGRTTIHLPCINGTYYTLCNLDGDDVNMAVLQRIVPVPDNAKVNCLDCFQLWNVSRKYGIDDFTNHQPLSQS